MMAYNKFQNRLQKTLMFHLIAFQGMLAWVKIMLLNMVKNLLILEMSY
jgi:hypothetical protein